MDEPKVEAGIVIKTEEQEAKFVNDSESKGEATIENEDQEMQCIDNSSIKAEIIIKSEDDKTTFNETESLVENKEITNPESPEKEQNINPFSYLERNEFSSEMFKIEINNLPSPIGYGELKKFLNKLALNPHKIKAIGKPIKFVFVTFRCEEDRQKALTTLNSYQWRKKTLSAKVANPMADPLVKKRRDRDMEDTRESKRPKLDENPIVSLNNTVTPLWEKSYQDQLDLKQDRMKEFLVKVAKQIAKVNHSLFSHMGAQRKLHNGQCCELLPIKSSPLLQGYRNKCELTIGLDSTSRQKTVGFRLGSYKDGSMSVGEPMECLLLSEKMKVLTKSFQEYIRNSERDVFNPETHAGFWRGLTLRETTLEDLMAIVVFHPQSLSQEEITKEKEALKEYYENGKGKDCQLNSLWFQEYAMKTAENNGTKLDLIFGKEKIVEELLGLKFHISPEAFFQVNTKAAELLYQAIPDMLQLDSNATVLDICCGTGTIGLSMAKNVEKVIGAELCLPAIQDARFNANINEIKNAEFVCGKAEDVIYDLLKTHGSDKEIVAILDPPRAGIHSKVIKALRGCDKLKKLAYVSCNPNLALSNMVDLARPSSKSYRGEPFVPVKALPVDLFPHTNHCELIVIFERYSSTKQTE